MTEEWRAVPGFDGYEVSNLGRVRSWLTRGCHGGLDDTPRILSPSLSSNGYRRLALRSFGKTYYFTVHRLVAKAFVGGYQNGFIVCHKDSNKQNNLATNLRWGSISSNSIDASKLGKLPRQVLSEDQVRNIRDLYKTGDHTHKSLSDAFGVTHQAIRDLLIRKNYRWVA